MNRCHGLGSHRRSGIRTSAPVNAPSHQLAESEDLTRHVCGRPERTELTRKSGSPAIGVARPAGQRSTRPRSRSPRAVTDSAGRPERAPDGIDPESVKHAQSTAPASAGPTAAGHLEPRTRAVRPVGRSVRLCRLGLRRRCGSGTIRVAARRTGMPPRRRCMLPAGHDGLV